MKASAETAGHYLDYSERVSVLKNIFLMYTSARYKTLVIIANSSHSMTFEIDENTFDCRKFVISCWFAIDAWMLSSVRKKIKISTVCLNKDIYEIKSITWKIHLAKEISREILPIKFANEYIRTRISVSVKPNYCFKFKRFGITVQSLPILMTKFLRLAPCATEYRFDEPGQNRNHYSRDDFAIL